MTPDPVRPSKEESWKAIEVVLAAYRSTAAKITEEQITAAWTAFEALKVEADRRQEALYLIEAGDFDDDPLFTYGEVVEAAQRVARAALAADTEPEGNDAGSA